MRILGRSQGPPSSCAPGLQRPFWPNPAQDLLTPDARSPESPPLAEESQHHSTASLPSSPTAQFRQEDPTIPVPSAEIHAEVENLLVCS